MSRIPLLVVCGLLVASLTVNASVIPPIKLTGGKKAKAISDDPLPPPAPAPAPNPIPNPNPAPIPPPNPPVPPPVDELPDLDLPPIISGDVGSFIKVVAQTNGEHVRWVSMDKGLAVFPGEMLRDSTTTVVMSSTPGQYRLLAYTALGGVPSDPVQTMIVVNGPQPPPAPAPQPQPNPGPAPQPGPAPAPPPAPIVVNPTARNLWIVVVDNVTSRDPRTAAILSDMNLWNGFTAQGHKWLKLNTTESAAAAYKLQVATNGGVPCIIIMDASKTDHNWLNQNPADLKLPATSAGVQALINKYTAH